MSDADHPRATKGYIKYQEDSVELVSWENGIRTEKFDKYPDGLPRSFSTNVDPLFENRTWYFNIWCLTEGGKALKSFSYKQQNGAQREAQYKAASDFQDKHSRNTNHNTRLTQNLYDGTR